MSDETKTGNDNPVMRTLERLQPQIAKALPVAADGARFVRIAMTALRAKPELAACEPSTIYACVMQAAQLGLTLNDGLGHAWLIDRFRKGWQKKECTLSIGYKGLRALARRAESGRTIFGRVVYERDTFSLSYAPLNVEHKPALTGETGAALGAYAVCYTREGKIEAVRWCHLGEIEAAQKRSPSAAKEGGPWFTDWAAMAVKTAIRRLCNDLDLSADPILARAIAIVDAEEDGREIELDPSVYEVLEEIKPEPAAIEAKPAEAAPRKQEPEVIPFGKQKEGKA